jgi:hypothetical protein
MEFVCFVLIAEQTGNFSLQKIKRLVFIAELESVYFAVRTEYLYNTDFVFKRLTFYTNLTMIPVLIYPCLYSSAVGQLVEALKYKSKVAGSFPDGTIGIFY